MLSLLLLWTRCYLQMASGYILLFQEHEGQSAMLLVAIGKKCDQAQAKWRNARSITGDDAHDACDCGHPYRTVRSPVNIPVHQAARNRSGAKLPAARDCSLVCLIS